MLELNKLLDNVEAMSQEIAGRREEYGNLAQQARKALSDITADEILAKKIAAALKVDYTWRGAEPIEHTLDLRRHPTSSPEAATLIAVDGSQIYPDHHGPALYYLINIGSIVFRQDSGHAPTVSTRPTLYFTEADLYDSRQNVITTEQINARRELAEMQRLAELAVQERSALGGDLDRLVVAMKDGQLMMWQGERDLFTSETTSDSDITPELTEYLECLKMMQSVQVLPVGFVGRPRSANVVRLLWLGSLDLDEINRNTIQGSKYRALTDRTLFAGLLGPNERSAIFASTARANRGAFSEHFQKICFFYMNVARRSGPAWAQIVRVDLPEWLVREPVMVDRLQNAIYRDCQGADFPYVLTRADEIAVVSQQEKRDLERLLNINVIHKTGEMLESSPKDRLKQVSRGYQR